VNLPTRIFSGVPVRLDGTPGTAEHLEIGEDAADLPTAAAISKLAGDKVVTLVGWHILTHRRSDPRYKQMKKPPPEHAAVGHFDRSRWTDEAWEQTDALARAVGAQAVLFRTPASFKATAEHATRLENFIAHATRPGLGLAWEWAPGSWPEAKALALCERLDAIPVVDPAKSEIPGGETVYVRFRGGASGRAAIKDDDLKKTALAVRDRVGWVVFANSTGEADAARFAQMI
jgi:uncharacterized protein YecE (DUF72 family)